VQAPKYGRVVYYYVRCVFKYLFLNFWDLGRKINKHKQHKHVHRKVGMRPPVED